MSFSLPKITELADQCANGGSIIMTDDNATLSCDGGLHGFGFMKKSGAAGRLAIDSSRTFAITRSSGGDISASNTFTDQLTMDATGNIVGVASFTSGAPSGGTAGAWKFGIAVTTSALTLKTTQYVQLDIGGTLIKLAVVN